MKKVMQGPVQHDVKVTRLKGVGHGVRVFVNGELTNRASRPLVATLAGSHATFCAWRTSAAT